MGSHRRRWRRAAPTHQARSSLTAGAGLLMALLDTLESALKLLAAALVLGMPSSSLFAADGLRGHSRLPKSTCWPRF